MPIHTRRLRCQQKLSIAAAVLVLPELELDRDVWDEGFEGGPSQWNYRYNTVNDQVPHRYHMQVGGKSNTGITVGLNTLIGPCVSSCEAVSLFRTSETKAVAFSNGSSRSSTRALPVATQQPLAPRVGTRGRGRHMTVTVTPLNAPSPGL